eukprot:366551-Chlamydomonas_euryale.AAC.18
MTHDRQRVYMQAFFNRMVIYVIPVYQPDTYVRACQLCMRTYSYLHELCGAVCRGFGTASRPDARSRQGGRGHRAHAARRLCRDRASAARAGHRADHQLTAAGRCAA